MIPFSLLIFNSSDEGKWMCYSFFMTIKPIAHSIDKGQPGKYYRTAFILSIFLGYFGVDRFYLGKIGTGVLKLLTFGGFGIWYIIDVYLIAHGKLLDEKDHPLIGAGDPDGTIRLLSTIYLWVQVAAFILSTIYFVLAVIVTVANVVTGGLGTPSVSSNQMGDSNTPVVTDVDNQKYIAVQLAVDFTDQGLWASYPGTAAGRAEIAAVSQMNQNAEGIRYTALPKGCGPTTSTPCQSFTLSLTEAGNEDFVVTQDNLLEQYLSLPETYRCTSVWPESFIQKDSSCSDL